MGTPAARSLALLSLLQTRRYWSGAELAERLDVSQRTVRRLVGGLRELGYPVDSEPGARGGYRLAAGAHMPPLILDDEEAVALFACLRAGAVVPIDGIESITVSLLAKLDQMLPGPLRRRVDDLRRSVDVLAAPVDAATIPAGSLSVLSRGCTDREEVRFPYVAGDGQETARLVRPYQLVAAGRRWYLVAWDVRRRDWRTFRVDRMGQPALAGVRFDPMELPADGAAEFLAERLRSLRPEHEATVVVHAPAAEVEATARWMQAELRSLGDDRTQLRLRAESDAWLASMIVMVAVAFDVELVEAPDEVRSRVTGAATRLLGA